MSTNGVQLRGMGAVLQAFDNLKISPWAVTYGKNINMKYAGASFPESRNTLQAFLQMLKDSDTVAVYTLHVYEDLPKGGKIKLSTEPDYSFNFLVTEDEAPRYARNRELAESNKVLTDRITALEAKLLLQEDEEEDEEPGSIGAVISGLLSDERVKDWIRTKAIGWADQLLTPPRSNVVPMGNSSAARVGAVSPNDPVLIDEEQQKKMQQAIEVLARVDSVLGDNLLKIAKIAENDPTRYQMLTRMI